MPEMPEWAAGARIIFDKEHNLAFIRRERRGQWEAWSYQHQAKGIYNEGTMTLLAERAGSSLPKARARVLEQISDSIGTFAMTLHPLAGYYHLARYTDKWQHACGIPYMAYKTGNSTTPVNCPICIAANLEDARAQADGLPPDKLQAATDQVRATRTMNALGAATGQDPGLTPA